MPNLTASRTPPPGKTGGIGGGISFPLEAMPYQMLALREPLKAIPCR
jgi:hypothetical protein